MSDPPSVVLSIADVAGVGAQLARALECHTSWRTVVAELPDTAAGSTNRVVHAFGAGGRAVRIPSVARRAVREVHPDVVHLHWARFSPLMPRTAKPLVVHAHGSDVRGRRGPATWLVDRSLLRADAVLASTPDLLPFLPHGARHLRSPIDLETFRPLGRDNERAAPRRVLVFARLSQIKGGHRLVELVRDLARARGDIEIVAFAGGAYDAAARGAGATVIAPADRTELVREICRADLVIGQMRLGTLGLSELEAMACERPVIAHVEPQWADDDLPVVAAEATGEGLLGQCLDLLADPARCTTLGRSGRAYVATRHAPSVVAQELAAIYQGVCGS